MADVVPEGPPPANRGLWMLVIGLGIAIIVVVALMIGIAVKRAAFDKPEQPATTASLKPGEVPELNLDLAPGMSLAETRMEGNLLIVRVTGADAEEVLVIDPAKSKVLARVRFNKKAP
jgi:hypothetical protein